METEECSDLRGFPQFFVGDSEHGMSHIFSYLNFKDLCASRSVSKFWFDVSLYFWLAKAPRLRLCEKREETAVTGDCHRRGAHRMKIESFVKRFHDDSCKYSKFEPVVGRQFQRFRLDFEKPPPPPLDPESKLDKLKLGLKRLSLKLLHPSSGRKEKAQAKLLRGFLASCGEWITYLELTHFTFPNLKTFEDVMYCKFTPELETLRISSFACLLVTPFGKQEEGTLQLHLCDKNNDKELLNSQKVSTTKITFLCIRFSGNEAWLPVGWTGFLQHYPKLEYLGISPRLLCNNDSSCDLLDAISHIRQTDKTQLQLTNLNIIFPDPFYKSPERLLLAFYQDAQLPLQKLLLYVDENTTTDFVVNCIKLHSTSLKELDIYNLGPSLWNLGWRPPLMEGLQKLKIQGLPVFRDLAFLSKFPSLNCLEVEGLELEEGNLLIRSTTEGDLDGVVMSSLTKFSYGYDEICSPAEIRKIQKWMPNLRWLGIAVTEGGQAAVTLLLPQLEEMHLRRHDAATAPGGVE